MNGVCWVVVLRVAVASFLIEATSSKLLGGIEVLMGVIGATGAGACVYVINNRSVINNTAGCCRAPITDLLLLVIGVLLQVGKTVICYCKSLRPMVVLRSIRATC